MNSNDLIPTKSKNAGFQVGLIGGVIMIFTSLAVFFMNGADTDGDTLIWLIQLVAYIFLARTAASRQAEAQSRTYEPARGVQGAGVGAALTTSLMMWIFIIVRGVVRDAMGMTITIDPVSFCGWIVLDVVLALVIGGLMGGAVAKQVKGDPYDTNGY
ncbi:MAG: hypothetical protein HZB18_07695 [Chloroflexi bacterium]|nr:hypothetical protein [Chloroflexota bacterium]